VVMLGVGAVHSDNPSPTIPPEKQAALDDLFNAQASGLANPPSPGATKNETIAPVLTERPWPSGIFRASDYPDTFKSYIFHTVWFGTSNGNLLMAYSGAYIANPTQGVIMVQMMQRGQGLIPGVGGFYNAPAAAGSLRIISANGHVLTLQSDSGDSFLFDADSRILMDGNGDPVPTDTPTPEPTPWLTVEPSVTPTPPATAQPTLAATAVGG
jgi:hypothetical protein